MHDTVWSVAVGGRLQSSPSFTSNQEEADTRVWLHAPRMDKRQIVTLSPDMDTHHVGQMQNLPEKHIDEQISPITSREKKILDLTAMKYAR